MSFSFGAAPAPASGGFSFGGATTPAQQPAGAPTGAPPPAPAAGGFSFGSAPAAGGGGAPAPGTTGFSFGGGSTTTAPAPAATGGFSFGGAGGGAATNAPASAFSFGSPAPAAPLFGAAPAPSTSLFGSNPQPQQQQQQTSAFGFAQPQQQQQQQQQQQTMITGNMPYASLPPHYRQAIDNIYNSIMDHKRTMIQVKSSQPHALLSTPTTTSSNSGSSIGGRLDTLQQGALIAPSAANPSSRSCPLSKEIQSIHHDLHQISISLQTVDERAQRSKNIGESLVTQAVCYGKWPLEAVAVRRGMRLYDEEKKEDSGQGDTLSATGGGLGGTGQDPNAPGGASSSADSTAANKQHQQQIQERIKQLLNHQMAIVDRVEAMPSPYLVESLEQMEKRLNHLAEQAHSLEQGIIAIQNEGSNLMTQLTQGRNETDFAQNITRLVEMQHRLLWQTTQRITLIQERMQSLRLTYRLRETGENVLQRADREEQQRERLLEERIQLQYMQSATSQQQQQAQQPQQQQQQGAPAPASTFGFGSTTPAPAPATTGFSFSNTPAPAPATGGGLFGSLSPQAAPAPAGLGFSSAAPAPSTGGFSFANTGAAPAPGAATTTTSTPNKKKTSSRRNRLVK